MRRLFADGLAFATGVIVVLMSIVFGLLRSSEPGEHQKVARLEGVRVTFDLVRPTH